MLSDLLADTKHIVYLFDHGMSLFHPRTVGHMELTLRLRQLSCILAHVLDGESELFVACKLKGVESCISESLYDEEWDDHKDDLLSEFNNNFEAWRGIIKICMPPVKEHISQLKTEAKCGRPERSDATKQARAATKAFNKAEKLRKRAAEIENEGKKLIGA